MIEVILGIGIALYFLIKIGLWIRYKSFWSTIRKKEISRRSFVFLGVDLAIFLAVIFQLSFPHFGKMHLVSFSAAVGVFGICLFIVGVFLSNWGRITLGRNWRPAMIDEEINGQRELITSGPFSRIRHPIYGGMILVGFGFELSLVNLFFLAIVPLVFLIYRQAKLEEKTLGGYFPQYEQYKELTGMFLPKFF